MGWLFVVKGSFIHKVGSLLKQPLGFEWEVTPFLGRVSYDGCRICQQEPSGSSLARPKATADLPVAIGWSRALPCLASGARHEFWFWLRSLPGCLCALSAFVHNSMLWLTKDTAVTLQIRRQNGPVQIHFTAFSVIYQQYIYFNLSFLAYRFWAASQSPHCVTNTLGLFLPPFFSK